MLARVLLPSTEQWCSGCLYELVAGADAPVVPDSSSTLGWAPHPGLISATLGAMWCERGGSGFLGLVGQVFDCNLTRKSDF